MSADGTDKSGVDLSLMLGQAEVETALTLASDLILVISSTGIIESVRVNPGLRIPQNQINDWVGRDVRDTLTVESVAKLDARVFKTKAPIIEAIELNHGDGQHRDYPIRYACSRIADEKTIMLGRDLHTIAEIQQDLTGMQLELERERQRQRQFETKYRLLMHYGRDPLMLVDADSGHVVDVNVAILKLLEEEKTSLIGKRLQQLFDVGEDSDGEDALAVLLSGGASAPVQLSRKGSNRHVIATGTIHRVVNDRFLLCQITNQEARNPADRDLTEAMNSFFVDSDESIVITHIDGMFITANESFLRLTNVSDMVRLKDQKLDQYLGRGSVDLKIVLKTLEANNHIKRYQTSLRDEFGAESRIDISATKVEMRDRSCIVFLLRETRGPAPPPRSSDYLTDDATQSIAELIGGVDLKSIVADTTEVIERMCIDIALEMTNNNRVAAANMLGLSRQSLYVKIRKYGL